MRSLKLSNAMLVVPKNEGIVVPIIRVIVFGVYVFAGVRRVPHVHGNFLVVSQVSFIDFEPSGA